MSSSAKGNGLSTPPEPPNGWRTKLPTKQPEKTSSNLWSFLKHCIGKELSKITMPVEWNEPLSLLQRLAEYTKYAHLLKTASEQDDSLSRMMFVATFAVSALSSNKDRMGKPFNPLLGETFELHRDGFCLISEQVGHHPPGSAYHVESDEGDFIFHGSMFPKVKFWGKSVEFVPKGLCTVKFPKRGGETFTWNNVNCVVHNIIVGSIWMEQQGTMEITGHSNKYSCILSFKPAGWFSGKNDVNNVEGFILNEKKEKVKFLYGRWTDFLCAVDVSELEKFLDCKAEKVSENASNLPKHEPFDVCSIPGSCVLWHADPDSEGCSEYYNFSEFTMSLNQIWDSLESSLCRTDCRLRPDIRALENGEMDKAAEEKERLEIKQREYRKEFKGKKEQEWWEPKWFENSKHEVTGQDDWIYKGGYWNRKPDEKVPDIY